MKEPPENLQNNTSVSPQAPASYRMPVSHATGEITEKKSRFIGDVFPVNTLEEAQAQIAKVQKQYHDARHHCHAFVVGERAELSRSSDNGEPSGTAGKPILEVITGAGLTNTLIVVTRYFGGVLLGTGGLVRAYTLAAQTALQHAEIKTHIYGKPLTIRAAYPLTGKLEHFFRTHEIDFGSPVYETDVRYDLFLPVAGVDAVINDLTNICDGNIDIVTGDPAYN